MNEPAVATRLLSRAIHLILIGGITLAAAPGMAQDDEADEVDRPPTIDSPVALDDVVVTARRREETLQDVPVAVTALSPEELDNYGIDALDDIDALVPNTKINAGRGTNSTINAYIRGVGQNDPLWGFEPGVGIYIDDVYVARPQGALLDIYDVQRIEVLRGPQGTLYGKNTVAGAIKYVTRDIVGDAQYNITGTVGSDSQLDLKISGSTPVSDTFYIGGTLGYFSRDGYGEVVADANPQLFNDIGDDVSDKDLWAARLNATWLVGEHGKLRLMADHVQDDSNVRGGQRLNSAFGPPLGRYDVRNDLPVDQDEVRMTGVAATYDTLLNENWSFKLVGAWRQGETDTFIDFETLNDNLFNVPAFYDDDQTSLEAQFNYASPGGDWNVVTGAYAYQGDACGAFDVVLGAISFTSLTAGCVDTTSYAVYADATWAFSDNVNINFGGRFNRDDKEASVFVGQYIGQLEGGQTFFDPNNLPPGFTLLAVQTDYTNDRQFNDFTPKLGVDWSPSDNLMLYASYTNGFKSGGFDMRGNAAANPDTTAGFDSETVDSFEIGVKSTLADGRVLFNVTAFQADYEDVQITTQQFVDINGVPTNVTAVLNAGEQQNKGLEIEARWLVNESFSIAGNLGLLDAEITGFLTSDPANPGTIIDISDTVEPINAPDLQGYLSAEYIWPIGAGDLSARVGYQYRDDVKTANLTPSVTDQDSYSLVDATIAYVTGDGHWRFALDGRNLTDEEYITSGYDFGPPGAGLLGGLSQIGYYGPPRTVSFSVSYRF